MVSIYGESPIPGTTNGILITSNQSGTPKILLAQYRNMESSTQLLALRASIASEFHVLLTVKGAYAHLIDISSDGVNFSKQQYFSNVTNVNTPFWIKTLILEFEAYVDDISNYLQLDYIRVQGG